MATMQGITGKLSGKMGSAVFRVRSGQQVVAQYNPIVKNPNTTGQQAQRAKFKLMSQLAAIMAPAMGSFIIKTRPEKGKQSQRNAFTQANFDLVEVSSEDQTVIAKVPMEELQLTSSFRVLPELNLTPDQGSVNVTLSGVDPSVSTIRFVAVGYGDGDISQARIAQIIDIPVDSPNFDTDLVLPPGKYTILAYGLIPSESSKALIDLDNIHTPADEDFISAVELNRLVENGSLVETMTVGANCTILSA